MRPCLWGLVGGARLGLAELILAFQAGLEPGPRVVVGAMVGSVTALALVVAPDGEDNTAAGLGEHRDGGYYKVLLDLVGRVLLKEGLGGERHSGNGIVLGRTRDAAQAEETKWGGAKLKACKTPYRHRCGTDGWVRKGRAYEEDIVRVIGYHDLVEGCTDSRMWLVLGKVSDNVNELDGEGKGTG